MKYIIIVIIASFSIYSCKDSTKVNADRVKESKGEKQEILSTENNEKCDIQRVVALKKELPKASKESIIRFLSAISVDCKNNAEFGQLSNEVLFEVLQAKPIEAIAIIGKENVDKNEIYKMLENPINDAVNLKELISNINKLEIKNTVKSQVLKALEKALEKYIKN